MKDDSKVIAQQEVDKHEHYFSDKEKAFANSLVSAEEREEWQRLRLTGEKSKQDWDAFQRSKVKDHFKDTPDIPYENTNKQLEKLVNKHLAKLRTPPDSDTKPSTDVQKP